MLLIKIFVSLSSLSKSKDTNIIHYGLLTNKKTSFWIILMLNIAKIRKEWFIEQIEALKSSGISYTEIAAQLGVKPQYINSIKNGDRGASENITAKLCKAFNINHNELLKRLSIYEKQIPDISEVREAGEPEEPVKPSKKVPLYNNGSKTSEPDRAIPIKKEISVKKTDEWIDVGNLFPDATSAIRHYGDSMDEYPSGSILVLKQVVDPSIIVWGRNYYIETEDLGITKRLQDGGKDHVIGYSSNEKKSSDGRLVHEPVKIPKKRIQRISLILGCVTNEFSKGVVPVTTNPS